MAQLGEASAGLGPGEDLALQGSVLLSGAWPPSLSSSHNPLLSDTSAHKTAISWLPCVSPAPPRPSGCGGICCSGGSRLETGCGRAPRRVAGLGTAVSSHLCASTWLCSSVFLLHAGAHAAADTAFGYPVSAHPLPVAVPVGTCLSQPAELALHEPWICLPNHVPI